MQNAKSKAIHAKMGGKKGSFEKIMDREREEHRKIGSKGPAHFKREGYSGNDLKKLDKIDTHIRNKYKMK